MEQWNTLNNYFFRLQKAKMRGYIPGKEPKLFDQTCVQKEKQASSMKDTYQLLPVHRSQQQCQSLHQAVIHSQESTIVALKRSTKDSPSSKSTET